MRTVTTDSLPGRIVLTLGHVGGMLDLVILPLWVGGMIATHALSPERAGLEVTLFLTGVLGSNVVLSPRFGRLPNRLIMTAGYALGAACFVLMTWTGGAAAFAQLAVLHLIAGTGVGAGLSCVHGTLGRSARPHRNFAIANIGVGLFAILFFATMPPLTQRIGVNAVFLAAALVLAAGAAGAALAFPVPPPLAATAAAQRLPGGAAGRLLALGFIGVVLMETAQAASTSFAERVGIAHGFTPAMIGAMFAINGVISLSGPILAALLEGYLPPVAVAVAALALNGTCAIVLTHTAAFPIYSIAFILMVFAIIFGHTFIFGLFARMDPSGRMNASTPSMLMLGTAVGPLLGGTMVQNFGYPALGVTAAAIAYAGSVCFLSIGRGFGRVAVAVQQAA
jgi:predicted MFS family arabinose efflux permease